VKSSSSLNEEIFSSHRVLIVGPINILPRITGTNVHGVTICNVILSWNTHAQEIRIISSFTYFQFLQQILMAKYMSLLEPLFHSSPFFFSLAPTVNAKTIPKWASLVLIFEVS
jgi:hypothetical protein